MTGSTASARRPAHAAHKSGTLSPHERSILWDTEEQFWTCGADSAQATTATNAVMVSPIRQASFRVTRSGPIFPK